LGIAAVLMAFNSLDYADVFAAAPLMADGHRLYDSWG
jgi:NADH-quinone oxidoreductase subunit L